MVTGTQSGADTDDNIDMNETIGFDTRDVYGTLWIGALMLASGSIQDPFPPELEEVVAIFVDTGLRGYRNHRRHRTRAPTATGDEGTTRVAFGRTVLASVEGKLAALVPAVTLNLACGPWREPVRGGPWDSGDPVKLVPKLAGGDTIFFELFPPTTKA